MPAFSFSELRFDPATPSPPSLIIPPVKFNLFPVVLRSSPIGPYYSFQNYAGEMRMFSFNGYSLHIDLRSAGYLLNTSKIPVLVTVHYGQHRARTLLSPGESIFVGELFVEFDPRYASLVDETRARTG